MKELSVFTDGGCSGNPGPGGWAFVILSGDNKVMLSGGEQATTNNRMELTAVISALRYISLNMKGCSVTLYTDSQYVQQGITQWISRWLRNGWRTADKKPVKNVELWQTLYQLDQELHPSWQWVKGHAGNTYNEMCDSMVRKEMDKFLC